VININCIISDCVFENNGKCTLTHVSTPSEVYNPQCIYFRPQDGENRKSKSKTWPQWS
jgi:hypothetical protein